jgi:uncharacterized repeat protein (TIGR03803 family)
MLTCDAFCKFAFASAAALALLAPLDTAQARFKVVHSFTGGTDGAFPLAGLVRDAAGNFYGTTYDGGGDKCRPFGCGTVFKIAPDGTETVLHSFTGGRDGQWPQGGLIRDKAGNLYGTTVIGGGNTCQGQGCGTVFKIASDGKEKILHSFTGGADGRFPNAAPIEDAAGNLYGTTEQGGTGFKNCTDGFGSGTIFEITRQGTEKILHSFTGGDGCLPDAQLIMDAAGNLYGTTSYGGTGSGGGTVFKLAPDGTETVLYSFTGAPDGDVPESKLIADAGNFYGTTYYGGTRGGGAVFKLAPDGTETVLYSFCSQSNCGDGFLPYAGLFRDRSGSLYGTTEYGGQTSCNNGCGVVFKLAPDGSEDVLYAFTGGSDGNFPNGDLVKDNAGHLYGTAGVGGDDCAEQFGHCGNVFRIDR